MSKPLGRSGRVLPVLAVVLLISGCAAVGPNYVAPALEAPAAWQAEARDGLNAAPPDPATLAAWWQSLNDPVLSGLMQQAAAGNLDLKQAAARVREARAAVKTSKAGFFPMLDAAGSYSHSRSSEERGGGSTVDLYSAGFDAGWELDVFGGVRRSVEAAEADLQAQNEDLHDVLVSLLAEVALNYVDARTYQARITVAEKNLAAQQETLSMAQARYRAGLANELAVEQATYNLESTRSQIPLLRSQLSAALNRIAALLGRPPGAFNARLAAAAPVPSPPAEIAVGVPAETLRHRPDVRRAERQLAAQTARVGVAVAELYPKFTLPGSIGLDALSFSGLFATSAGSYSFAPGVKWSIFSGGAIRGNIEIQSARQEQALLQYRSTVLAALEEVENAMVAYAEEQRRLERLAASAQAAANAADLAEKQYQAGLTDFTTVLDSQRSLLSFQDQLAQSTGAVTDDLVRIYKALGGGWTPQATVASGAAAENELTQK